MMAESYLMSLTTSQHDVETTVAIINIVGPGAAIFGSGDSTLYIVPKGRTAKKEVIAKLKAIPTIKDVAVVALSNPVNESELPEVRALFSNFGLDASGVTDEELSLFLNAKLKGQYTYYLKFEWGKRGRSDKIYVRPVTELPGYSAERFKARNAIEEEALDKVYTVDDIEVRSVVIQNISAAPPPLLPGKVKKMSDAQIRQWIRKHGFDHVPDKDILIERTAEEIEVTIKPDETTTISTSYKVK